MLAGTVVSAVHVPAPLLLLPVVPDELLPPDELPLPVPPEPPPLPPASGKLVDELLEQPARPAVNEIVESAMSPKT